jgi:hypothetical protein
LCREDESYQYLSDVLLYEFFADCAQNLEADPPAISGHGTRQMEVNLGETRGSESIGRRALSVRLVLHQMNWPGTSDSRDISRRTNLSCLKVAFVFIARSPSPHLLAICTAPSYTSCT